ncbi:MAG: hypothetical protein ABID64_00580 [Nitrospirota bacterium]
MDPVIPPNNKDKIFKGQQTNEQFLYFFRHHWVDLLKELVFFGIFVIVIGLLMFQMNTIKEILQGNREMKLLFFTAFLSGTVYMHRFFIKMLNYFANVVIITNSRVIDHNKTLFFTDNQDSIDMGQIQNIEKVQEGIMPSLFKYGDIKIFLNASDTIKTFNRVPNAKFHFRALSRAKEDRQRDIRRGERGETPLNIQQQPNPIPFEEQQQLNTFR